MVDHKNPDSSLNEDGEYVRAHLTEDGRFELVDDTPVAPPLGYRHGPSLNDTVMRLLYEQRKRELEDASAEDLETFEEADDFDVDDETPHPVTPYEAAMFAREERLERERLAEPAKKAEALKASSEAARARAVDDFKRQFPDRAEAVDAFLKGGTGDESPVAKPTPEGGEPAP